MIKIKMRKDIQIDKKVICNIFEFIVGFILTRSIVFFNILPLAMAFSLAHIKKTGRLYSMLGAFLGYLLVDNTAYGFKYAGALVIVASLSNLTRINIESLILIIMPTISFTDMVIDGFSYKGVVLSVCEVVICISSMYLYTKLVEKNEKYQKVCILFFIASIISSLSTVTIFFEVAPIRILAVLVILLATFFAKTGTGCIISVVFGVAMDSSLGVNSAIFTLAYSFASVVSGTFINANKAIFSLIFAVMYIFSAIFAINSPIFIPSVLEVLVACFIFIFIPNNELKFIEKLLSEKRQTSSNLTNKVYDITSNASNILLQMSQVLDKSIEKVGALSYNDVNKVYYAATENVCKNCELAFKCWNKEYISSIDALNATTSKVILKGYFNSTDFPLHFSTRCINFVDFLNFVNQKVIEINKNNQINQTLESNKEAISKQCNAISAILKEITYSATQPVEIFPNLEQEIKEKLNKYAPFLEVLVYNNSNNKFFVDLICKNIFDIMKNMNEISEIISNIIGTKMEFMSQSQEKELSKVVFRQRSEYKLEIASKNLSKRRISGDVSDIFTNNDSVSYIILSDGMGSGIRANTESIQVIELLSKMLKSGIGLSKALKGIAPLICIKNNEKNFVALDVLSVDLSSLEGVLAKYGAAPTYILRQGKIHKISSKNLPLGLGQNAEISRVKLVHNDIVLMLTDGIESTEEDDFIVGILKNSKGKSCNEICEEILNGNDKDDDKTIIAIKVNLNN